MTTRSKTITIIYRPRVCVRREKILTPENIDKLRSWYRKPLTPRAECATAAICGTVTFILFVLAAIIGG